MHLNGDPVWSRECPVSAYPVCTPPVNVCEVSCCSWSVGTCGGQWGKYEGTGGANVCGGQMKSTDEWRGFFWLFARWWNVRRVLRYRRDGKEVSILTSIWKAIGMQVSGKTFLRVVSNVTFFKLACVFKHFSPGNPITNGHN